MVFGFGSREELGGSEVLQYFELYLMVGIWVVGAQQVVGCLASLKPASQRNKDGGNIGNSRNLLSY
jgi:hypothetical protein